MRSASIYLLVVVSKEKFRLWVPHATAMIPLPGFTWADHIWFGSTVHGPSSLLRSCLPPMYVLWIASFHRFCWCIICTAAGAIWGEMSCLMFILCWRPLGLFLILNCLQYPKVWSPGGISILDWCCRGHPYSNGVASIGCPSGIGHVPSKEAGPWLW